MKTPAKKNNKNPTTLYNYYFNSKSFSFLIIILSPEALSICEVINKNKGTDGRSRRDHSSCAPTKIRTRLPQPATSINIDK